MVIDTSVCIEFLRSRDKTQTRLFEIANQPELMISSLTVFELYMGTTDEQKRNDVVLLLSGLEIVPFDSMIAEKAGDLYRFLKKNNQLIGVPDLLIASTALVLNHPILTINKGHFSRIPDLVVL
ncbi:MAG: type II toxin-antitoxin system VapC family toxin [Bacteroidia bacterium]